MRLWSVHPSQLDAKGLVALWRETLLAKKVLEGKTKGYQNHPQLNRFKQSGNPLLYINYYLSEIWEAATKRGYHFDVTKFQKVDKPKPLTVTNAQVAYEYQHLLNKLKVRDEERYHSLLNVSNILVHPLFIVIEGEIEDWEVV